MKQKISLVTGILLCGCAFWGLFLIVRDNMVAQKFYENYKNVNTVSKNIAKEDDTSNNSIILKDLSGNLSIKNNVSNNTVSGAEPPPTETTTLENNYINVKDTNIYYPVVQGEDNKYYLNHLPDGTESKFGSIFMDYRSDIDDFNTIIYGHNIVNGRMFGQLHDYVNTEGFVKEHSTMELEWNGELHEYELFSVQRVEYYDEALLMNPSDKAEWVTMQRDNSLVELETTADENSKFVTLSTCGRTDTEKVITIWVQK